MAFVASQAVPHVDVGSSFAMMVTEIVMVSPGARLPPDATASRPSVGDDPVKVASVSGSDNGSGLVVAVTELTV